MGEATQTGHEPDVRRRIALASCDPFPAVVDDEEPLRSALRVRGYEVVDPAWDAAFDWASCAAVLLRCTWDYHTRCDEFVAWCERTARLTHLFHGPHIVRWNVDKRYLAQLAARGVPIAPTVWLDPESVDLDAIRAAARGWRRGFLKPVVGANASDTLRFSCDEAGLEAALAHVRTTSVPFMLQPYLDSVERDGELSIIAIDGEPSHAIRKVPAAGDYRVQEDWGARDEPWLPDPAALKRARDALGAAADLLGERLLYGRVDLLKGDDGYVLNELELVEPALFFRHSHATAERLAAALCARLTAATRS